MVRLKTAWDSVKHHTRGANYSLIRTRTYFTYKKRNGSGTEGRTRPTTEFSCLPSCASECLPLTSPARRRSRHTAGHSTSGWVGEELQLSVKPSVQGPCASPFLCYFTSSRQCGGSWRAGTSLLCALSLSPRQANRRSSKSIMKEIDQESKIRDPVLVLLLIPGVLRQHIPFSCPSLELTVPICTV